MVLPEIFSPLAVGIGFTEGPLWTSDGRLLVTSMSRGLVYSLTLGDSDDGPWEPLEAYETGGGPNGLAEAAESTVYVAQNGDAGRRSRSARPVAPGLQTIRDGVVADLPLAPMTAPNDLVVDAEGRVWFTDPEGGETKPHGSRIRVYDPASGAVTTVIDDLRFPNGLAFSPDGSELFVADSEADSIIRYGYTGGRPGEPRLFAEVPGMNPDGIAFDAAGNLYVAAFGSNDVVVLDQSGRVSRRLPTGESSRPTNLCFAGATRDILVVTLASGGRVVALRERIRA